jgi:hypothetical protein
MVANDMTSWIGFLVDATTLYAIFDTELPTLEGVDVHEIVLNRDGPRVSLRFDLSQYPKLPPKKWQISGFNKVQLTLMAVGVHALSISGWKTQCKLNLEVSAEGNIVRLHTHDGPVKIDISAESLILERIIAYIDNG